MTPASMDEAWEGLSRILSSISSPIPKDEKPPEPRRESKPPLPRPRKKTKGWKFCPYCRVTIREDGICRNRACKGFNERVEIA